MPKRDQISTPLFEPCPGGGVRLEVPKWADFEDWAALRKANLDYLSPWEPGWNLAHLTRPAYKTRLATFQKMLTNDQGYPFHVFRANDDTLIGGCNVTSVWRGSLQSAHIGYWIGEKYIRQGFARASVIAVLRFCFKDLGLHRMEAAVKAENRASINLLEATGFTREGIARGLLKINGQWQDHIIYARLSSD